MEQGTEGETSLDNGLVKSDHGNQRKGYRRQDDVEETSPVQGEPMGGVGSVNLRVEPSEAVQKLPHPQDMQPTVAVEEIDTAP